MPVQATLPHDILVIDLGSTWLKGGWASVGGELNTVQRDASPLHADEHNPQHIWAAVTDLLATLLDAHDAPQCPRAISITGATRSHIFLDDALQPIGPLILWDDPYGQECAAEVAGAYGVPEHSPGYGAYHPLARLAHFRQSRGNAPDRMVELKDWLNFLLCGRLATDSVTYSRIEPVEPANNDAVRVLSRLGFSPSVIPEPMTPYQQLGTVQPSITAPLNRLVGVPVVVSSFDTWCATLGMGAIRNNDAYDISGTTEVMGMFESQIRHTPGLVSMPWAPSIWHIGGPCQTGLGTLAWFAQTFLDSTDPASTLEAARNASTHEPPIFLPYLSGERMPWWNSRLCAQFENVRAHHTRSDFARAVTEGSALAHRVAMNKIDALRPGTLIHMSGGGTQHKDWCQLRANAFGVPIAVDSGQESALAGAALAAGVALGDHQNIQAAQQQVNQRSTIVHPDGPTADYFNTRLALFDQTLQRSLQHV